MTPAQLDLLGREHVYLATVTAPAEPDVPATAGPSLQQLAEMPIL